MEYKPDLLDKIDCPRCKGLGSRCSKLSTFDWLADLPDGVQQQEIIEVQFKNTRKNYYRNVDHLDLKRGDYVVVEADSGGYDVGMVALTGTLVSTKIRANHDEQYVDNAKAIYRKARPADMDHYRAAKLREHPTMIESREIATSLGLDMKIGDVEYQADGTRAIFYYIADQRVDFRKLIRLLADAFHIRVEMRQIGARQEAGRIGGIGPCGRALCCATWLSRFNSVSTAAARFQNLAQNSLKLTGQCGKLKCCTNYEVDVYMEAKKAFPSSRTPLETESGTYYFNKCDLLAGEITYSLAPKSLEEPETISVERAKEIIEMNQRGETPETLSDLQEAPKKPKDILFDNAINRFDQPKKRKRRKSNRKRTRSNTDAPRAKDGNPTSDRSEEPTNAAKEGPERADSREEGATQPDRKPRRKPQAGGRRRRPRTKPQEE